MDLEAQRLAGTAPTFARPDQRRRPGATAADPLVLQLQPLIGNRRVCSLQRSPGRAAGPAPAATTAEVDGPVPARTSDQSVSAPGIPEQVTATAASFDQAAAELTGRDPRSPLLTEAEVDQRLDGWYGPLLLAEQLLDTFARHRGDLRGHLRTGYLTALDALISAAVPAHPSRPFSDHRERNTRRLPLWAWSVPHERVPGYTPPVPVGGYQRHDGNLELVVNGVPVRIHPDETTMRAYIRHHTDRKVAQVSAHTNYGLTYDRAQPEAPPFGLDITTRYAPGLRQNTQLLHLPEADAARAASEKSSDLPLLSVATVSGLSRTPREHEGDHVTYLLSWLRRVEPPRFSCPVGNRSPAVGDPARQTFIWYVQIWADKWNKYLKDARTSDPTDNI